MKFSCRKLATATLGAALAATLSASASADGLMDKATGDGLNVAYYNFIPYAYKDDDGNLTGTDGDTLARCWRRWAPASPRQVTWIGAP